MDSQVEITNTQTPKKVALLVGATGLIGHHLLELLLHHSNYSKVLVQARSSCPAQYLPMQSAGRLEWLSFDDQLPCTIGDYFCALGTTQKQSGKDGLVKVDRDLVVQTATVALAAGASLLSIVSALGANENSLFFYNRTKGQMESDIERLNPKTLHLWQPSLLLGERSERRAGEGFASVFMKGKWLGNLSAREGAIVAKAMVNAAQVAKPEHIRYKVRSIDLFSKLSD